MKIIPPFSCKSELLGNMFQNLLISWTTFVCLKVLLLELFVQVFSSNDHSIRSVFTADLFSFFLREYDNLKGTLKASNDMCEKLKREVLSSNNKVIRHKKIASPIRNGTLVRNLWFKCSVVFVISVTKNYNRGESDQRGHEVSAERSGLCWQRNLCKADQTNLFICYVGCAWLWFLCATCPQSLKKKVEFLQKSLSTPTRTNEAVSRLIFERCVSSCGTSFSSCFWQDA